MSAPPAGQPAAKIRSFVRRQGRMTAAQHWALSALFDRYCLPPTAGHDFPQLFGQQGPLVMEIGFGNGESLLAMAKANPGQNFLGVEVHRPGVGHLLLLLEREGVGNVRIVCHDALEVLAGCIDAASLAGLHLFFPDPWPKKKHHKRRIVNPEFCRLLVDKLTPGGYFHAATDWLPYAQAMLEVLGATPGLVNLSPDGGYHPRPPTRPLTKFEQRGLRLGHGVWDLLFVRQG